MQQSYTFPNDKATYIIEGKEEEHTSASLTIKFTEKLSARFKLNLDGTSEVTTPNIPRYFNAYLVSQAQTRYQAIITDGRKRGLLNVYKILQRHFETRKTTSAIRNT
jgi:hypothetical protein